MSRSNLSPTLQAAIAHAQFETIHPFANGNGCTGRCLIHVCYRRAALAPRFAPPVSLLLATDSDAYIRGLTAFRTDSPESWYLDFALTVIRLTGAKTSAAHDAINQLQAAGVLKQISVGRRNRAFEAAGLLNLIDEFERALATPEPDGERPIRATPFLN